MTDEAKRAALNIRTTTALKDRLQAAGERAGRTMSQEADLRLAQSFAREDEAGGRASSRLADFVRVAAGMIEAQTGNEWTEDADTYSRLHKAVSAYMAAHHPAEPSYSVELAQAQQELVEAEDAFKSEQPIIDALFAKTPDPEAVKELSQKMERFRAALARFKEATDRSAAEGLDVARALQSVFGLRSAPEGEDNCERTPENAEALGRPRFRMAKREYGPISRKPTRGRSKAAS